MDSLFTSDSRLRNVKFEFRDTCTLVNCWLGVWLLVKFKWYLPYLPYFSRPGVLVLPPQDKAPPTHSWENSSTTLSHAIGNLLGTDTKEAGEKYK